MSQELPKYPNPQRPDQILFEENRSIASPLELTAFFLINLGAAYAPAIFSYPFLFGLGKGILLVIFSPVVLGANESLGGAWLAGAWLVLSLYLAAVSILSAVFYQSTIARFVVPGCLFAVSILQQVIFINLI